MRVEPLQFDAGVVGCELPIGLGVMLVAMILPSINLSLEGLLVGNTAAQALCRQNGEFGFGHVEPTSIHAWACNAIRTALLVGGPRPRERRHRAKPPCAC